MLNINKRNLFLQKLLTRKEISTKIKIYMSIKIAGDDFDDKEQNYTCINLNPLVLKGYVRDLKPETQYWKQYGYAEGGVKEIFCDSRYAEWFRRANKIEIGEDEYSVYKDAPGSKAMITIFPFKLMRVVLFKQAKTTVNTSTVGTFTTITGTYRQVIKGTDLVIERLEGGVWVEKARITA